MPVVFEVPATKALTAALDTSRKSKKFTAITCEVNELFDPAASATVVYTPERSLIIIKTQNSSLLITSLDDRETNEILARLNQYRK